MEFGFAVAFGVLLDTAVIRTVLVPAIAFAGLFEGLALLWMVDPQTVDPARESARAVDLLLDGLRVPPQHREDAG